MKHYDAYLFDLYGTLVDIHTDDYASRDGIVYTNDYMDESMKPSASASQSGEMSCQRVEARSISSPGRTRYVG